MDQPERWEGVSGVGQGRGLTRGDMSTRKKRTPTPKANAGTSKAAAAHRRRLFVEAYLQTGGNATEAAKCAGFSEKTAYSQGQRLLKDVEVQAAISFRRAAVEETSELTTKRTLDEIARIAFFDPRGLFRPDGSLKPASEWTDEQAAAISSVEIDDSGKVKVRFWDKNSALEKAAKHLGLYETDNKQRARNPLAELLAIIDGTSRGLP